MLQLSHLTGFNVQQLPELVFLDGYANDTDRSSVTLSAVNLGAAQPNRRIFVAVTARSAVLDSPVPDSVTVNGVSASSVVSLTDSTVLGASIWVATVPSGATGDVVVTWPGNMEDTGVGVYRAYNLRSSSAFATANNADDVVSMTLNVPPTGVIVACATFEDSGTAITTSGVTEDIEGQGDDCRMAIGHLSRASGGSTNISFDGGGNAAGVAISWA
jgi:hypothetical protein